MRKINISKYEGNTHYSVTVTDSYKQEHHIGYLNINLTMEDIYFKAEEIWQNEVKRKENLLGKAILNCKEIDKNNNNLRTIL